NEGHKGLSDACAQEAAFKDFSSISLAPSRYMADAKDKLAQLSERRNNTVRAKRYRAEAQAMRTQAQALTTQSTVPSDQDAIAGLILEQNDRGAPTVASKSSAISALTVGSSRVVKIGATWTKGQNLEEMQALLRGPKGTKVDISCLDTNGSFATETIELKSPEQFKPPHFYSPMGYFERVELSSSNPSGQNEVGSVMHFLGEGAALQSQAICANLLHGYPYGYNKPQLVQFIKSCPSVANFFISSARFDRLVEVKNFVEKQLAENHGYISDDELKAADETLEALKPYLNTEDLQAFQASVKNAHQASEQMKTPQALDQKVSQKGDLAGGFKPHIWFDGPLFIVQPSKLSLHEKLLQQLYADASSLFSRGQFEEARLFLIDAIKKIDEEAEQINFERAMPISRSDFFVLLAAAEARLGNTDNATAAINKAITKITDALGPSSPCLAVPLAVRKVIEAKTP
ncbi:MAG: hypothetical protein C0507_25760, partial [Cyanobacteria bacterium PR.3.49]|nr:hypothetical protein [Cyanobacteria bacterium PR.3.49]